MHKRPTPTQHQLKRRLADFSSLAEALDYAADGETGCNYYSGTGQLVAVLAYAELRDQALALARRLHGLGLQRGARVALVADTNPSFQRFFFACQYAGLVPVPVAPPLHLGGRTAYVEHLHRLLANCRATVGIAPTEFGALMAEAAEGLHLQFVGSPEAFSHFPDAHCHLRPSSADELAHLQYTSGSTRFPRGVMISQRAVLANLAGTFGHIRIREDDRCMSWLPYYHDMGLVGLVLGPIAAQLSVDYLGTREFAMRPRQWLVRMADSRATISFSPPFGYELCVRRLRESDVSTLDLSAWRIAGIGAEKIRPEPMTRFAEILAPCGFTARAFLPCYGLAESSLAVSCVDPGDGLQAELVDGEHLAQTQQALPLTDGGDTRANVFVNCGRPLDGHEVVARGSDASVLPDRQCGTLYVRGPSVMSGYFGVDANESHVLSADGWLDTGDIGYRVDGHVFITGRKKDLIVINGRNIWPQDLEYLAEQEPEVRSGEASAFSVSGPDGSERAVLVIQCRESDPARRQHLTHRLDHAIRTELGIECVIELVPPHTLVRTSSGKLSRSRTRQDFLERTDWGQHVQPQRAAG
ncbi:MAG: fatty acyl-AMP ligase [Gammaproteobacteria bacterium]|nr:fatty acyl-AMP ligase [Gammaproteobacteria bacterium]